MTGAQLSPRHLRALELCRIAHRDSLVSWWDMTISERHRWLRVAEEEEENIERHFSEIIVRLEVANESRAVRIVQEFRKERLV
jgi:hypothetical protein